MQQIIYALGKSLCTWEARVKLSFRLMQPLPGLDTSILHNFPLLRVGFKFTFKLKILLDFPQGIYYSIIVANTPVIFFFFGFILLLLLSYLIMLMIF